MSDPLARVRSVRVPPGAVTEGVRAYGRKEAQGMDRDKMLDVALTQIEKQYGKGAVMRLGEHPAGQGISVIPTGSMSLDIALGVGGIPRGRIVEVFGPEGSKTSTMRPRGMP